MSNIQEICDYLTNILKYLNNKENIGLKINEIYDKILDLSNNDSNVKQIIEIIESNLDEIKQNQTSDEFSKHLIISIDLMIRLIILLNNYNENELISTNNFYTIKLSIIKLISLTIIPYISQHFQQINHLFLSFDNKSLISFDNKLISRLFVSNLTKLFINFLNTKSIVTRIVFEDCLPSLMASLMTVKHESDTNEKPLIETQLNQLLTSFDQIIIIRNLLLLSRCKANKWSNNEISRCLSRCLTQNNGLISLINAVLDCDQTSEKETTFNQRYHAIGTIVSAMPQLYCSLPQYYESIGRQVLDLLIASNSNYHRIGPMIVLCLDNRNSKLTQEFIFDKILDVFLKHNTNIFSLNNAIEIIHKLIIGRIDCKKFLPIVSNLFYIRIVLEDTVSHLKSVLNDIIVEIFNSIKQSVYLLDNILYNNYNLINDFETDIIDDIIGVKFKQIGDQIHLKSYKSVSNNKTELSLKQIDSMVQNVIFLIEKMNETFKIDFFLILIERMTFNIPSLLTCSLVDSIHESVSPIMTKYCEKSIKFVVNTFRRLSEDNNSLVVENSEDINLKEMKQNSLNICLQIVKILLKEKHKISEKEINQLKECIHYLEIISKNEFFDENSRNTAIKLKERIDLCGINAKYPENDNEMKNEFELAMNELNDPLMPVRAHSLIRIKRLIYAKDRHLLENKDQLMNALKMCLNDSESYIYLSAVNTLSTLAIYCTEDVLPILIQQFNDSNRSVEERVKVGEVLIHLSKSIGDFAHHFSKQYINCFLIGVKSEEAVIRISSLSNLGQFCSALKFALKPFIVELMVCIECILRTDEYIEVKRSSVMFLHLMLRTIDNNCIEAIDEHLKSIYRLLRQIYSTTIDDILQLHSQLAIEEIDRIARNLFTPNKDLIKNIKILNL